ncbi:MAG TPA: molybdopterin-guanine dinucleotide biosynthesis protein B [Methylocella sp.]|nr:molybdopterin-guanine dinucleotide biosynthesis protein B [Methylocella sp.]
MRVIGFAGWSGAGKTTLIVKLITHLSARGFRVSTLKHAHHDFDIDQPGKDSFLHREAGACEVLVASARRFALIHELRGAPEPSLAELLTRLSPVDLLLIEGFRRDPLVKIEVHRAANGKPWLYPEDPHIVAVATDAQRMAENFPAHLPYAGLDEVEILASLVLTLARPIADRLTSPGA